MPFVVGQNATILCVTDTPTNYIVWKQDNGVVTDHQFRTVISHLNLTFNNNMIMTATKLTCTRHNCMQSLL